MLIRCDVDPDYGLDDLARCLVLARGLSTRGYRVAFAVRKTSYAPARALIGEDFPIFRLPMEEDEEIERLGHLHRKHKHQIIYIDRRTAQSAYLFRVRRLFSHTVLYDRGGKYMIYADTIINTSLTATNHAYQCIPEAHLLLGVKFHFGQPIPEEPLPGEPTHLLVDTGDHPDLLYKTLEAFVPAIDTLTVHVLCRPGDALLEVVRKVREQHGEDAAHPVHRTADARFPFERYPVILSQANHECLDLARTGRFFVTIAAEKDQLATAYSLEQLGVSPTLGWHPTKQSADIRALFERFLSDREIREPHIRAGLSLFDGKAIERIAHFLPGEPWYAHWADYRNYKAPGRDDGIAGDRHAAEGKFAEAVAAYQRAAKAPGAPEFYGKAVRWIEQLLAAKEKPHQVTPEQLGSYVGSYGPRRLFLEDGRLIYQREERDPLPLTPLADNLFAMEDLHWFRIEIEKDEAGKPIAILGHYLHGDSDRSPRD
jgi:spore coat polysaccharide biosynthesis predicted glycosyltransferase SpsG